MEVASEAEAATICGYLESQEIHAVYDKGGIPTLTNMASGPYVGRQEILVARADLDAAREALAAVDEGG
jgi:hypothetical protein